MAASLTVLVPYYDDSEKSASRSYLSAIPAKPGDVIITTGKTYVETEYYVNTWNLPVTLYSFPRSASEHPGYLNYDELKGTSGLLESDAQWLARECRRVLRSGRSVFSKPVFFRFRPRSCFMVPIVAQAESVTLLQTSRSSARKFGTRAIACRPRAESEVPAATRTVK